MNIVGDIVYREMYKEWQAEALNSIVMWSVSPRQLGNIAQLADNVKTYNNTNMSTIHCQSTVHLSAINIYRNKHVTSYCLLDVHTQISFEACM